MCVHKCTVHKTVFDFCSDCVSIDKQNYIREFSLYLPGPLVFHFIMYYLSPTDLGRMMQVSKTLKNWIISDNVLWRLQC